MHDAVFEGSEGGSELEDVPESTEPSKDNVQHNGT